MDFGSRIKALRLRANMTQLELAERLNVTAQAVSRWERNIVEPNLDTLANIVKVFNISFDELLK